MAATTTTMIMEVVQNFTTTEIPLISSEPSDITSTAVPTMTTATEDHNLSTVPTPGVSSGSATPGVVSVMSTDWTTGYSSYSSPLAITTTNSSLLVTNSTIEGLYFTNQTTTPPMTVTGSDLRRYLDELQDKEFQVYLPALVFLLIIAVTGFCGNIMVLIVYRSRYHRSPTRVFIIVIALFDLVSNVFGIPGEIYDMFHLWEFYVGSICRLIRYCNATTTITSACVLLALSVVRYRKICRPFGWQVTSKHAKIISVCAAIFGSMISILFAIVSGIHSRVTPLAGIFGKECTIDDAFDGTMLPLINNGLFLLVFMSVCVPLVVLYCLIGAKAYRHSKMHGHSIIRKTSTTTTGTGSLSGTEDSAGENTGRSTARLVTAFFKKRNDKYTLNDESKTESSDLSADTADKKTERSSSKTKKKEKKGDSSRSNDGEKKEERLDNSVRMVRYPSRDEATVNFSMVNELASKLNKLKEEDGNEEKEEKEKPSSDKQHQQQGQPGDLISRSNSHTDKTAARSNTDDTVNAGGEKDKEEINDDIAGSGSSCIDNIVRTEDSAGNVTQSQSQSQSETQTQSGLASRLQWIDRTYSTENNNDSNSNATSIFSVGKGSESSPPKPDKKESRSTPSLSKKSSLSRKVSRENSLLRKHRKLRDNLSDTLTRSRREKKGEDDKSFDINPEVDHTHSKAERSGEGDNAEESTSSSRAREGEIVREAKANDQFNSKDEGGGLNTNNILMNSNDKSSSTSAAAAAAAVVVADDIVNRDRKVSSSTLTSTSNIRNNKNPTVAVRRHVTIKTDDNSNKNKTGRGGGSSQSFSRGLINKTTIMLCLITSVFIIGYIPYILLMFYRFAMTQHFLAMGPTTTAIHHLFLRFYFINSAANSVIYSLCDTKFRQELVKLFKCKRR